MVPTFTCGLVRSNFFLAILLSQGLRPFHPAFLFRFSVSPPRGSNPRPRPYQGRALPTELGGQSYFSGHEKRVALRNSLGAWVMKIIRRTARKGKKRARR